MKNSKFRKTLKKFINEIDSWSRETRDGVILIITVFFAVLFIILLRIPFFREFVAKELGEPLELVITSLLYIIVSLYIFFWVLFKKIRMLLEKLEETKLDFDDKLNFEGTDGIYKSVNEEMKKRKILTDKVTIDIIGYTLYSVQPKIIEWKKMGLLKNIEINICHLDPSFIENNEQFDKTWSTHLKMYLKSIGIFIKDNELELRNNKVKFNFYPYKHNPGVHGFRLSNGSLFMSFANWDGGIIEQPTNSVFVHLRPNENSQMAFRMRLLFRNWLEKSKSYAFKRRVDGNESEDQMRKA
ncbi:hypothetical protein [Flagellimonas meishanensis]|uniref:hypothetical protein n=1 Tax=Flagellimonas meishanensis TaxID=2873264 RepID=UPI001CA784E3|nr:hypothetical protein [[Muricauda] meishanensis]